MRAYSAITVVAMAAVIALDLWALRTRLLRRATFWLSLGIMYLFQIFVDGWLTRARETIVIYQPERFSGVRVFFHTPLEDFGFGFALILLTLSVWHRLGARPGPRANGQ